MATLDPLRRKLEAAELKRVQNATRAMTADLKRTAPVDTGTTKKASAVNVVGQQGARINAVAEIDTDYAVFVVEQTRPHKISAKKGKALRFNWPKAGGVVYFASVNHPGTRGNEFFRRVVEKWPEYLRAG